MFSARCAVCHGCYDAPCQFTLDSFEAIERGANEHLVYDPARLTAAQPLEAGLFDYNRLDAF